MSDFDAADIAVFVCIELAIFAFGMALAVMFPEATALVWFAVGIVSALAPVVIYGYKNYRDSRTPAPFQGMGELREIEIVRRREAEEIDRKERLIRALDRCTEELRLNKEGHPHEG